MKKIQNAIMKGFSYYLPFIIVAALLTELGILFSSYSDVSVFFSFTGYFVFQLTYIVLTGFIAFAIADRLALLPGFVGGILTLRNDLGFISALIAGVFVGYLVLGLKYVIKKSPRNIQQTLTIVWIPLLSVVITYLLIITLGLFMSSFTNWYEALFQNLNLVTLIIVCGILAMLMAYDLGGPVNKFAYIFAISTIGLGFSNALIPAVMVGGMIPPMAIGLFHLVNKNRFDAFKDKNGWSMILSGSFFISEAAIPFYTLYGKKVSIASLLGSLASGLVIGIFNVSSMVVHGGVLVFFTTSNIPAFFLAIVSGILVSFIILIFTTKKITVEEV